MANTNVQVEVSAKDNATPVITQTTAAIEKMTFTARRAAGGINEVAGASRASGPSLARLKEGFDHLSGEGPSRGLRMIKSSLAGVALESTGLEGPLGRMSEGFLMFGGGGLVTVGVLAGVAAMAMAWRAFTKDIRENDEAIKKLQESFEKLYRVAPTLSAQIREVSDKTRENYQAIARDALVMQQAFPILQDYIALWARHKQEVEGNNEVLAAHEAHLATLRRVQIDAAAKVKQAQDDARHANEAVQKSFNDAMEAANMKYAEAVIQGQRLRGVITDRQMEMALERLKLQAKGFTDEMIRSVQAVEQVTSRLQDADRTARVQQGLAGHGPATQLRISPNFALRTRGAPQPVQAVDPEAIEAQAKYHKRVEATVTSVGQLKFAIHELGEELGGLGGAWDIANAAAESHIPVLGAVGKVIQGAIRAEAGIKATLEFAEGIKALAAGIFPPNPAALASAAEHFKAGAAFAKIAGSGSGGSRSSPSGAGGASRAGQQAAAGAPAVAKGNANIIIQGGLLDMTDPKQADALAKALNSLDGRNVTFVRG